MVAFYASNAATFLRRRDLLMDGLHNIASIQYKDAKCVLLTSSAVHGVANASSDIDLICIRGGDTTDTAMATQLHCGENHIEVIAFSERQLRETEAILYDMAVGSLAVRAEAAGTWNRLVPIPRKYVERIATGVDANGCVPYQHIQASVCAVWVALGVEQARQCAVLAALACRCGERRAAMGYATNTVLSAMNALLSALYWPLLNKKWTVKRWSAAADWFVDDPLYARWGQRLTNAWQQMAGRLGGELDDKDAFTICHLVDDLVGELDGDAPSMAATVTLQTGLVTALLLPGACLVSDIAGQRSVLLPETANDRLPDTAVGTLLSLPPRDAAFWLGASRAGFTRIALA